MRMQSGLVLRELDRLGNRRVVPAKAEKVIQSLERCIQAGEKQNPLETHAHTVGKQWLWIECQDTAGRTCIASPVAGLYVLEVSRKVAAEEAHRGEPHAESNRDTPLVSRHPPQSSLAVVNGHLFDLGC